MLLALGVAALAAAEQGPHFATPPSDPPEIRALWVDAFHAGIRSPAEADELIAAAKSANLNTLFVQVRRRGDALYTRGIEPPLDDPSYDPSFDALAYVVDVAHHAGIEVHAWVNAMPTWRDELPPKDPRHVFNRHGPAAAGDENWFTASPTGTHRFPVGYFLDPGHPAAAGYLADIYVNIVRNYAVDGIHFDYIRYPETDERLERGAGVGYNAVNLARFRRSTGRTDTPEPGDEQWMAWRRQQVTNLVRRVSIEAKAINPRIKISAALIPWGRPPTREKDFVDVAPMQRIFQDWHQWMQDGLIDLGVPMNYATETDDRVRGWFDGWIRWEKRHKHGRQLAVGLGAYRNAPEHTLGQLSRVRNEDDGNRADGVSFFSYAVPSRPPQVPANIEPTASDAVAAGSERLAFLSRGAGGTPGAFTRPAPVPPMPWIERSERGWIAGMVTLPTAEADGVIVKVRRAGFALFRRTTTVLTDGNGFYGLTNAKPGRYRVWLERGGGKSHTIEVTVEAGKVARVQDLRGRLDHQTAGSEESRRSDADDRTRSRTPYGNDGKPAGPSRQPKRGTILASTCHVSAAAANVGQKSTRSAAAPTAATVPIARSSITVTTLRPARCRQGSPGTASRERRSGSAPARPSAAETPAEWRAGAGTALTPSGAAISTKQAAN